MREQKNSRFVEMWNMCRALARNRHLKKTLILTAAAAIPTGVIVGAVDALFGRVLLYLKKTLWVCFACLMAGFLAFSAFAMQDFLLVLALAAAFLVDSSMFEGLLPAVMEQLSLFDSAV